jgi:hypothetical protein
MTDIRTRDERAEAEPYWIGARHRAPLDERNELERARARRSGGHPLEFDESGFPVPQHDSDLIARVRRLLGV